MQEIITTAETNARRILHLRYSGVLPTRQQCHDLGMSLREWQWAVALLRAWRYWYWNANSTGIDVSTLDRTNAFLAKLGDGK